METLRVVAPRLIDRYEVIEELGRGGYGSVYRARHQFQNREVALKVLRAQEDLDRFLREAEVLASLRHPNIVESFDAGRTPDGGAFLALELLEGESLTDLLRRSGAQAPAQAAWIVDEVLAALEAAHAAGVIHRDVKPGNVFLAGTPPRVKLLDFGISKIVGGRKLTGTGRFVGTPRYIPPEVLRGAAADVRTDVYGAGVLLYELLSGRPLFIGQPVEVLTQKLAGPPVPVSSYPGGERIPRALEAVVDRALAPHESRFPSAAAMRGALQAAMSFGAHHIEPSGSFRIATGVLTNEDADPFSVADVSLESDEYDASDRTQVDGADDGAGLLGDLLRGGPVASEDFDEEAETEVRRDTHVSAPDLRAPSMGGVVELERASGSFAAASSSSMPSPSVASPSVASPSVPPPAPPSGPARGYTPANVHPTRSSHPNFGSGSFAAPPLPAAPVATQRSARGSSRVIVAVAFALVFVLAALGGLLAAGAFSAPDRAASERD